MSGDPREHPCPVGKYCPKGSLPIDCPVNTYRDKEGGQNISDCFPCPAGFWCQYPGMSDYRLFSCPIGKYCPEGQPPVFCPGGRQRNSTGGRDSSDCKPCPAGFYCPFNSTQYSGIPCAPGTYCSNNETDGAASEKECPGGYYCPARTGTPFHCPGEKISSF